MSLPGERVVVVGGGVIGAACAHFLAEAGLHVTVIDRGGFGRGCSHGNCGFVCPSHVLPLAEPGAIGEALRALFRRNSPFKIRLRFDGALWSWLWHFARRCNARDMLESGRAIGALLESSMALYREIIPHSALDCEWQTRGLLFAFRTQAGFEAYAHTDEVMTREFELPAVRLDGAGVRALEPALRPEVIGGFHYAHDAHLRPDKLMSSWRKRLEERGVEIREQCEMHEFSREGRRARGVATRSGEIAADWFVVAAGALTPVLSRALGCRIPIQPGKGYSLTMPRPAKCPAIPLLFPETRVAVTPFESGYRLGSTMEFAGYDATIDPRRLALLRDGAIPYLEEPLCEPVEEEWCGWRPMTFDGKPIIDKSPAFDNVFIAAGHNMLGLSMAPGTGKLVAELVTGAPPHIDPGPYSVRRF